MKKQGGQSIVEVLVAIAVFVIGMVTFTVMVLDGMATARLASERGAAYELAREGIEAARSIRDASFGDLTVGNHGIAISGGRYIFSGTSDSDGTYTRIISVGAPSDTRRAVTSTVSWELSPGRTETVSLSCTLTDWRYGTGVPSSAVVAGTLNLPGTTDAVAVAASGTIAYVGRLSSGTTDEFAVIDVSSSTNPVLLGQHNLGQQINALAVHGNHVYAGTTNNNPELYIYNVSSSTSPALVGNLGLAGNGDITALYVSGTRLYVTRTPQGGNPTFQVLNVTNPTAPTVLGGLNLGDAGNDVVVLASSTPWAFIAGANNTQEFQAVNTTNPAAMGVGGSINLNGSEDALAVAVSGTMAYLGSSDRSTADEIYTVNVTSPTVPATNGSISIGANVNVLRTNEDNTALVAGTASTTAEFMLLDAFNPFLPRVSSTLNLAATINDMALISDTVYAVTGGDAIEFLVISLE